MIKITMPLITSPKKQIPSSSLKSLPLGILAITVGAFAFNSQVQADDRLKTDKLQIVFMLGQSEMVGKGELTGAAYMLSEPLLPERELTVNAYKQMEHQINGAYLYWQAMNSYAGPAEKQAELKKLIAERAAFKAKFKAQVIAELEKNDGMFRGKKYSKRGNAYRGFWLFNLCDDECETQGFTPKIRKLLDAPDNKFGVKVAYDQVAADTMHRYQQQQAIRPLYFKGATTEDFAAYAEALKAHEAATKEPAENPEQKRAALAALAQKHLRLPQAKRTYITAIGTIPSTEPVAGGKLSIGYGANERSIGLEYAAGIALEQKIDAPVLIIKCAWNSPRSLKDFWMLPSGPVPADATPDTEPGVAWRLTLAHIRKVLADPGKYHPDYDPKAGYEAAGLVWCQGAGDKETADYATQLAFLVGGLRKEVKAPELPVVCVSVGNMFFKAESDDHSANAGMHELANMPRNKASIEVVDSHIWRPSELAIIRSLINKRKIKPNADMKAALSGGGSAFYYLLAGHEVGSRLAGMMAQRTKAP